MVRRGVVRIPSFQRPLKWRTVDVLALFDSIYRGYPVGSFLLRKGAAPAATLEIGPLSIDGPETQEALWVVDGQQRLIALTAGLSRPRPVPTTPVDVWVVYFDAGEADLRGPSKDRGDSLDLGSSGRDVGCFRAQRMGLPLAPW